MQDSRQEVPPESFSLDHRLPTEIDHLFTRKYQRCSSPVVTSPDHRNQVLVAVPGGVVFVSYDSILPRNKTLWLYEYGTQRQARMLFRLSEVLQCSDIESIAFTGSLLVVLAVDQPGNRTAQLHDERHAWAFTWNDLRESRVQPVRLPFANCTYITGAANSLAAICDGKLSTLSHCNEVSTGHEISETELLGFGDDAIIALSVAHPQMIALASGDKLCVTLLQAPQDSKMLLGKLQESPVSLAISDNGQMVAVGYRSGLVELWDAQKLDKPLLSLHELLSSCICVAFSGLTSDRLFAAGQYASEVLVIDTRDMKRYGMMWLPSIPRPSDTLSRYDLRSALWPESQVEYELPSRRPRDFIAPIVVRSIAWMKDNDGVLALGTNEGILFVECGRRKTLKSKEWF